MKNDDELDDQQLAKENWNRYQYGLCNGHSAYIKHARECERFYLGEQWSKKDLDLLNEQNRPSLTFNQIMPKINAAIGYQLANRVDISYKPRGGVTDDELANTLSKLTMQVVDNIDFHWKETEVFSNGLIMQRGYFDIRISYDDTLLGEIAIDTLDPIDVIPDPDANNYNPDQWADVIVTRWLTKEEIINTFKTVSDSLETVLSTYEYSDGYRESSEEKRNSFAGFRGNYFLNDKDQVKRYLIIDRQYWTREKIKVFITPTGDIRHANAYTQNQQQHLIDKGYYVQEQERSVVKRVISLKDTILYSGLSPYNHFTVIPFFPVFRRGITRGLVDNALDPQKMLNKTLSQALHIVNTTSNSGWMSWDNTLANMQNDELGLYGSKTGLNVILKKETPIDKIPRKIEQNPFPSAMTNLASLAEKGLADVTGINEAMQGQKGAEISGIAIQSRQYAAQQQLALALDNLSRTRSMVGKFFLELIQTFYDLPRVQRITELNEVGNKQTTEMYLNYPLSDGGILNDLTIGEYDVVISEQPIQVTFDNSQFNQLLDIANKIPSIITPEYLSLLIKYSNIADKQALIQALNNNQKQQPDPLNEAKLKELLAKIEQIKVNTEKTQAETVNTRVQSIYSGVQAANVIASTPQTAPVADQTLKSAGFLDQDEEPIVSRPLTQVPNAQNMNPSSTNPITPAHASVGMMKGIETPQNDPL